MRLLSLLISIVALVGLLLPVSVKAEEVYLTTPMKLWVDVPGGSGTASFKIFITNQSGTERTFDVSHWYNYMNPPEDYRNTPEEWITSFTPNHITLGKTDQAIVNVKVEIPEGVEPGKYLTWLKVRDDPVSEERPIVVIIRTGAAVPTYEYSMEPAFYQLEAIFLADNETDGVSSDALKLTVRNTGAAACGYRLYVPHKFAVNGEPWRNGITYRPIYELECADTIEEMAEIVKIPESQVLYGTQTIVSNNPKTISAYGKGDLPFELNIPAEVPNGWYEARVGVQIADGDLAGTSIGVQYECRLLIHVDHQEGIVVKARRGWWLPLVIGGGLIVGLPLTTRVGKRAYRFWKRRNGRKNGVRVYGKA